MTQNFTITGTPVFAAGHFGNGVTCDASDYLTNNNASAFVSAGGIVTIEYWAKTSSTSGFQIVVGRAGAEWVGFDNGQATIEAPGGVLLSAPSSTADGAYHHYAFTIDGTNVKIWVDGVSVASAAAGAATSWAGAPTGVGSLMSIGCWFAGSGGTSVGFGFVGQIDEVRFSSIVRYTTTFTPATSAFTGDVSTTGLYHLEADGTDSSAGAPTTNGTAAPAAVVSVSATSNNVGGSAAPAAKVSVTATGPSATFTIAPNDTGIVYSPYNWNQLSGSAQTVNPGAYLRVVLAGSVTSLTANVGTAGTDGSRVIEVRVDQEPAVLVTLANTTTSFSISIPSNGWAKHVVKLTVVQILGTDLWTTPTSTFIFTGFSGAPGGVATATNRRRPYNILAFGDSITRGYSTTTAFTEDGRLGWAFPLADDLGAEVGVVGFSAQGFSATGGANVPIFGSTYNLMWTGVSRSFTTPVEPNLILINMGTNDGATNDTAAMTTVLNAMLATTVATKIVIVQQWSGTAQQSFWQAAAAACTTPSRVFYLDTTGWLNTADTADGLHPWGYINLSDLSPRVAAALTAYLPALRRFLNKSGVPTPIQGSTA